MSIGVTLVDALLWRDQVENVRRKCFAGLAKLRRLRWCCHLEQRNRSTMRLCFLTVAGVFNGAR